MRASARPSLSDKAASSIIALSHTPNHLHGEVEQSSVTLSVTEASSDRDTPECRRAGAVYLSSADNTRSEDRRGRTAPLSCTAD